MRAFLFFPDPCSRPPRMPTIELTWPMLAALAAVLLLALETRLRKSFATEKDLNAWGGKVNSHDARVQALEKEAATIRERQESDRRWMAESIVKTLDRVCENQDGLAIAVAKLTATVEHFGERLDREDR